MNYTVKDRFLKYVQVDTEADPLSETYPSSAKQKDLTKIICQELDDLKIEYKTNDAGYIYAYIPSNIDRNAPKVFFCAHLDTAPDCSGKNVRPIVHSNYQGQDIKYADDASLVLSPVQHPNLNDKIGHDIITASGLTLLGSDDKSGVAIIMDTLHQLVNDPRIPHGDIRALFTTDEEIGKGVAKVDLELLDADFGYTLDSGDLGCFEDENFSANSMEIRITGVSAHPGYAKDKMENAIKIAGEIVASLPKLTLTPETTEKKEGFIHPTRIEGTLEQASINFILRDFETHKLDEYADIINNIATEVLKNYPNSTFESKVKVQYRNMKDVLDQHPHVSKLAIQAMENLNIPLNYTSIRGGTDGATLSHMGKPCPNLFAGEQAIHSKYEWTSVQDMQRGVDTVIEICRLVGMM
ncbi:MAG TPA: peptidase T [Saprospiraceae bacterium]|nr:peptidase T [Saprospiraceae bacterium]HRP42916.1 peptidase T [Saprospiraceae bacterium]